MARARFLLVAALVGTVAAARTLEVAGAEVRGPDRWKAVLSWLVWRRSPQLAALPEELVWHVLEYVPLPAQAVAAMGVKPPSVLRVGEHTRTLRGSRGRTLSVKFFPAGDRLVAAGAHGEAVIWDLIGDRLLFRLKQSGPHKDLVDAQVFPEGDKVLLIGSDGSAIIWSASTGDPLVVLSGFLLFRHTRARIHPRGDRVVTAIAPGSTTAVMWSASDGRAWWQCLHGEQLHAFQLSPCGGWLATAGVERISLWSTTSGRQESELVGRFKSFAGIVVTEHGEKVVATDGQRLHVWHGVSGSRASVLDIGAGVENLALLPCGRLLSVFSQQGAMVWNLETLTVQSVFERSGGGDFKVYTVAASSGIVAACGGEPKWPWGQHAAVWDPRTGKRLVAILGDLRPQLAIWTRSWPPCAIGVAPQRSMSSLLSA